MSEISNISNKAHDIDANIDDPINCKYYSVEDLKTIPKKKALNIFHSNVNGLDTQFEYDVNITWIDYEKRCYVVMLA